MNSSLRMDAASGILLFCKLASASLNDTSLTFIENVENALVLVRISGCGMSGGGGAFWSGTSRLLNHSCSKSSMSARREPLRSRFDSKAELADPNASSWVRDCQRQSRCR